MLKLSKKVFLKPSDDSPQPEKKGTIQSRAGTRNVVKSQVLEEPANSAEKKPKPERNLLQHFLEEAQKIPLLDPEEERFLGLQRKYDEKGSLTEVGKKTCQP